MLLEAGIIAFTSFTAATAAAAQDYCPLSVEDTVSAHVLSEYSQVEVSLDGKWIAYAVRETAVQGTTRSVKDDFLRHGLNWYGLGAQINMEHTATNLSRNLTGGTGSHSPPPLAA